MGNSRKKSKPRTFRVLVLTDHATHRPGESIYPLLREMSRHSDCAMIMVASRSHPENVDFFYNFRSTQVYCRSVTQEFVYEPDGYGFLTKEHVVRIHDFDFLFLRLDRPFPGELFTFLIRNFNEQYIINRPSGIHSTGSKEFLLKFPDICPPMRLCVTIQDVLEFRDHHPIVLKPLKSYGGQGLIRVEGDALWQEESKASFSDVDVVSELQSLLAEKGPYLGMKFMKNVSQGDKRVIVVNGKIMGAMLRMPREGSWLCNLARGGVSYFADVDEDEKHIAACISPPIIDSGVVIFGFDTLVDDDGHRILSEINTLNVGGLYEAELHSGRPVVKNSSEEIWNYMISVWQKS